MNAIRHYVWAGDVKMVERMVAAGCDIHHIDNNGCTHLWIGRGRGSDMQLPRTLHQTPPMSRFDLVYLRTPVANPDRRVERPCGTGKSTGRTWRVCQDAHIW